MINHSRLIEHWTYRATMTTLVIDIPFAFIAFLIATLSVLDKKTLWGVACSIGFATDPQMKHLCALRMSCSFEIEKGN